MACLPKWLQNATQIDPEAAKLIPKWPSWRSCWPILALLTAILAPNSSNLGSKKPQDGAWNAFFSTFLWRSPFPWPILVAICDRIAQTWANLLQSSIKLLPQTPQEPTTYLQTEISWSPIPPNWIFMISTGIPINKACNLKAKGPAAEALAFKYIHKIYSKIYLWKIY